MFVPQQRPLNYYRDHNAYQLKKSACSRNQNSKASIKWKMRSRHKIIPTNIKGFCEFGLEAVTLFHRILCAKKSFYSAFNFPTILRHGMALCCIDVRLVSGKAAVSLRLPTALKWKSISGHTWCDQSLPASTPQPCSKLFLVSFGLNSLHMCWTSTKGGIPATNQDDKKENWSLVI